MTDDSMDPHERFWSEINKVERKQFEIGFKWHDDGNNVCWHCEHYIQSTMQCALLNEVVFKNSTCRRFKYRKNDREDE